MKSSTKITISYRNRKTKCPFGCRTFTGKDADVLAANFQSEHPELEETHCDIER